jgi:hypothetical protein
MLSGPVHAMSPGARPFALLLALTPAAALADSSIQCDGGIVSVGDSKIDLLGKCGPPALVEDRWRRKTAVERWTYNFGPNRFLQLVTLVNGKVAAVERGGYGYPPEKMAEPQEPGRARCETSAIRIGDSKIDLLAKCGEPALQESRLERRADAAGRGRFVQVDVWTYDFGPQSFVQHATLENGKVVLVERGGYGYAR